MMGGGDREWNGEGRKERKGVNGKTYLWEPRVPAKTCDLAGLNGLLDDPNLQCTIFSKM